MKTGRFYSFLRDGAWMIEERVVFYAAMTLVAYCLFAVGTLWLSPEVVKNRSYARDFSSAWIAGSLAWQGRAPEAYDEKVLRVEEKSLLTDITEGYYAFFYPPVFILFTAMLALLSYGWAQIAWLGGTAVAYVAGVRRLWPHRYSVLVAMAWPGFIVNLLYGQNGFFSTALLAAGLLLLETHALAAGFVLGVLCYKPQIALLVPLALLAGGHWRALFAMAASVLALCVAAAAAFGFNTWLAFLSVTPVTRAALEEGGPGFYHIITVFSSVRQLGVTVAVAYLIQGVTTIATVAALVIAWRSRVPIYFKGAVLAAAIPLATPFALAYDLVINAIAIAGLAREAQRTGFRPWEQTLIAAVCLMPVASPLLARVTPLSLAPWAQVALLATLMGRIRGASQERS